METTFLPTGIELDNTLWIIFAALTVVSFAIAVMTAHKYGLETVFLGSLALTVGFALTMAGFVMIGTSNAEHKNVANLTQNIHTAYDVDDVKIDPAAITTEDGTVMWKATVYEGDTAYEVEIRQDEKTFEPTLISFESDEHIRELKK